MEHQFSRLENLIGSNNLKKLQNSHVAVFGICGVGGYVCEALARSGIENIDLIDNDTVSITNLNRQIIATHSTVGQYKTEVMKNRILDINPNAKVTVHNVFYLPETAHLFDFSKYDYILDCVDTVKAKIDIICRAKQQNIPVISAMGAGNKTDPAKFEVSDIYKTSVCPLARVMRRELKARRISSLKVVYSKEEPNALHPSSDDVGKLPTASVAFTVSVAGLLIAREVVMDLLKSR